MTKRWTLEPSDARLPSDFGSLDAVFALEGECMSRAPSSEMIRVERDGICYYVKRYCGMGKGWWRRYLFCYLPRPRIQAEWQNMMQFARWGIPTADIVAYGLERRCGAFLRGAMITREIVGATDLSTLLYRQDLRLKDRVWVLRIIRQTADCARRMHDHRFIHNDLKWRNILVDENDKAYFIDCPWGGYWFGPMLRYRIEKDLATLDKVAKDCLSATQRLRFYLLYRRRGRLDALDKKSIRRIVHFFDGDE